MRTSFHSPNHSTFHRSMKVESMENGVEWIYNDNLEPIPSIITDQSMILSSNTPNRIYDG